mgnify:CR=1 FL=1
MGMNAAFAANTWYVGEGLKEGDYFRYTLCQFDYKKCAEFEMDFWVEGKTDESWNLQVLVIDGDKKVRGNMTVGRVAPEPLGGSDNLSEYRSAYKSSIVWLSGFATRSEQKDFSATSGWGKIGSIGGMAVGPLGTTETITVPAGTFETQVVGWHKGADNKIWVKDDFPFPIKALTFVDVTTGSIPIAYEFELLEYGNTANPPDFLEGISTPTPTEEKCPPDITFVSRSENLDTGKMIVDYRYSPENPKPGCQIQWNFEFNKWFDANQFESDVHYDIFVVDEKGIKLRSFSNEQGRDQLFTPDGKDLLFMDVKESKGIAHYFIHVYGTGPDGVAYDPEKSGTLKIDLAIGEGKVPPPVVTPPKETTPTPTPTPQNGCLIATASFGSELAPQVQQLRETRDNILLKTQSGTSFMTAFNEFYYSFSPTVADWERQNPVFREVVKTSITPLITTLSILNYVNIDSETEMLGYGISVILLNIGMYFVAPALVIVRLTRHNK